MRPFEIALLVGNLLTFGLLVVPRTRATDGPVATSISSTSRGCFTSTSPTSPIRSQRPSPRAFNLIGPVDWRRGHAIVNAYTLAFFDRHLRRQAAPLLDAPSAQWREVSIETRYP